MRRACRLSPVDSDIFSRDTTVEDTTDAAKAFRESVKGKTPDRNFDYEFR
jgi:hypothetical protein